MGTWWIAEPFIMGSSNPSDDELARLRAQGFTVLVCLLDESQQRRRYDVNTAERAGWTHHSLPVPDFHAPTLDQLGLFTELVQTMAQGTKGLVHGQGGSGRTGTMAAAYWIANGLTAPEAIARVRQVRPGAVETDEQTGVLQQFAQLNTGRRAR